MVGRCSPSLRNVTQEREFVRWSCIEGVIRGVTTGSCMHLWLRLMRVWQLIYELRDETGDLYYFNSATGMSSWEPPEWIDSMDPVSGAVYYENTLSGDTQWEKPFDFIPVIREEAYSTPEADFIKSVLSPKRSRGPRNFYSPHDA